MKRLVLSLTILLLLAGAEARAQRVALKTNAVHWAALGSPNASLELALGPKVTLDLYGGGNLWKYRKPLEVRHWLLQPELRYWLCEAFNGTFIGLHGHYGEYNLGGIPGAPGRLRPLREYRYEGYFYGAGLSLGHQWILSDSWSLEGSLGAGWAHSPYKRHACTECGPLLSEGSYDYFGLTRALVSLTYFFN